MGYTVLQNDTIHVQTDWPTGTSTHHQSQLAKKRCKSRYFQKYNTLFFLDHFHTFLSIFFIFQPPTTPKPSATPAAAAAAAEN